MFRFTGEALADKIIPRVQRVGKFIDCSSKIDVASFRGFFSSRSMTLLFLAHQTRSHRSIADALEALNAAR